MNICHFSWQAIYVQSNLFVNVFRQLRMDLPFACMVTAVGKLCMELNFVNVFHCSGQTIQLCEHL